MRNALYPRRFGDTCPYCGSENVGNDNDIRPTAEECSVECICDDCSRSHRLNYSVTSVTLENNDGVTYIDFHYPVADLQDQGVDESGKSATIPVSIYAAPDGIMLMAAGYGDGTSTPGYGAPIIIENYNGQLRVVVWDDINDDDTSQIIELGEARYSQDQSLHDLPFRAMQFTPNGVQIEAHQFRTLDEAAAFASERLTSIPEHYAVVSDTNGTSLSTRPRCRVADFLSYGTDCCSCSGISVRAARLSGVTIQWQSRELIARLQVSERLTKRIR